MLDLDNAVPHRRARVQFLRELGVAVSRQQLRNIHDDIRGDAALAACGLLPDELASLVGWSKCAATAVTMAAIAIGFGTGSSAAGGGGSGDRPILASACRPGSVIGGRGRSRPSHSSKCQWVHNQHGAGADLGVAPAGCGEVDRDGGGDDDVWHDEARSALGWSAPFGFEFCPGAWPGLFFALNAAAARLSGPEFPQFGSALCRRRARSRN
jgi:hypothetical protein